MNRKTKQLLSIALSGALSFSSLGAAKADGPMDNHQLLIVLQHMSRSEKAKMFPLLSKRCKKVAQMSKINPSVSTKSSVEDRKKDYELFTGIETLRTDFNDHGIIQKEEEYVQDKTTEDVKQQTQEQSTKTVDAYAQAKRIEYVKGTFTADDFQQQVDSLSWYLQEIYKPKSTDGQTKTADEKKEKSTFEAKEQENDKKEENLDVAKKTQPVDEKEEKSIIKENDQPAAKKEKGESTEKKENGLFVKVEVEVITPLRVRVTLIPEKLGCKTEVFDVSADYENPEDFYNFVSKVSELIIHTPQYFNVSFDCKCQNLENLIEMWLLDPDTLLPMLPKQYDRARMQSYISEYEDAVFKKMSKSVMCKNVKSGNWLIKKIASKDDVEQPFKIEVEDKWITFKDGTPVGEGENINPEDIKEIIVTGDIDRINADTFANCEYLEKIDLSKARLKIIDDGTFYEHKLLTEIKFPKTLQVIGFNAFRSNIKVLNLSNTNVVKIYQGTFLNNMKLEVVLFPTTIEEIDSAAFIDCNISKLDLSDTKLITIGSLAFSDNKNMREINLPKTLREIGASAFINCNIKGVLDLSNTKVEFIDEKAFKGNDLKIVKLPELFPQYVDQNPSILFKGIVKNAFAPNVKFQIGNVIYNTYDELPKNLKNIK